MNWKNETTMTMNVPTTPRRKRIAGPTVPEDPAKRTDQVRAFVRDLAELHDCDHHDAYNSVFFTWVGEIMEDTVFDDTTATIRDLGRKILETRSTSVKLYIAFFKAILVYLDTV
jgi:hypothetical protein